MLTRKVTFGYILWLTEEEMNCQAVLQEIETLKSLGRVVVFCSGKQEPLQVIKKLLLKTRL